MTGGRGEGDRRRELHPALSREERRHLFRQGVELFNAGRFYECHEAFEAIWRSTTPEPRDLHQGLIQVAVGLHHWLQNRRAGAGRRVLARGRRRLAGLAPHEHGLPTGEGGPGTGGAETGGAGALDVPALLAEVDRWLGWLEGVESGAPEGPPPLPRLRPRDRERRISR